MPKVLIAGGGLAGMSAAAALGGAGFEVELFEARPFPGGRATSYTIPGSGGLPPVQIDNCQHVLLRCCVNLIDFYTRLGVLDQIEFHRELYFIEPGGRVSRFRRGLLPAPLHFAASFASLRFLEWGDKVAVARALLALRREHGVRRGLDRISMLDWLREKRQTPRAIERFWRQVLLSAINEELDRMAACHGFQVFWLAFLARAEGYEMGVARVPLGELYSAARWQGLPGVKLHLMAPVEAVGAGGFQVRGKTRQGDYHICALPFERLGAVGLEAPRLEHAPIAGIHLWFDRPVTALPHASLLDRTIQWMFNKDGGRYLQLVVSASHKLTPLSRSEVIECACRELAEFFPAVGEAKLLRGHVVKEQRATFSAAPGTEELRPGALTETPGLFLAGDWTRSGWPSTMEGAVRSGYLAAEAVAAAAGRPQRFLLPDIA
jgi:squalene-associated FAD-dependent desaturase